MLAAGQPVYQGRHSRPDVPVRMTIQGVSSTLHKMRVPQRNSSSVPNIFSVVGPYCALCVCVIYLCDREERLRLCHLAEEILETILATDMLGRRANDRPFLYGYVN